jgi:hypothetical protein
VTCVQEDKRRFIAATKNSYDMTGLQSLDGTS